MSVHSALGTQHPLPSQAGSPPVRTRGLHATPGLLLWGRMRLFEPNGIAYTKPSAWRQAAGGLDCVLVPPSPGSVPGASCFCSAVSLAGGLRTRAGGRHSGVRGPWEAAGGEGDRTSSSSSSSGEGADEQSLKLEQNS